MALRTRWYVNRETEKYIRFVKINLFCKKYISFVKKKTLDLHCMTFKKRLQSKNTKNTTSMHACMHAYAIILGFFVCFLGSCTEEKKKRTFLRNVQRWHLQYKQQMKRHSNSMSK